MCYPANFKVVYKTAFTSNHKSDSLNEYISVAIYRSIAERDPNFGNYFFFNQIESNLINTYRYNDFTKWKKVVTNNPEVTELIDVFENKMMPIFNYKVNEINDSKKQEINKKKKVCLIM